MNRLIGIATAMLLTLLVLVPVAAAAGPWTWGRSESLVITSGADITLAADQSVNVLVVTGGHARIEGRADAIFVLDGTAELVGARANGIVAIEGIVTIDAGSIVSGDIRAMGSTITGATAATHTGRIRDLAPDIALGWLGVGSVLLLIYAAFAISMVVAGVVLAGLAGRQVRAAGALITEEPLQVVGAALFGLIGLLVAGILAMITIVGIPFGVGLLLLVLPALFVVGYLVVGIWVGERILEMRTPLVARERPYLAALIGLSIVGFVSVFPPVGGLIGLVGLGAVVLQMWHVVRRDRSARPVDRGARQVATVAG